MGDEAEHASGDETIAGQSYQEVLTNFPLGSQILTGLFLDVTLEGPQGPAESYEQTLVDRIGYAARQGLAQPNIAVDPNAPPIINDFDVTTLNILAGLSDPESHAPLVNDFETASSQYQALVNSANDPSSSADASAVTRDLVVSATELYGDEVLRESDLLTTQLEQATQTLAYFVRPRITITSSSLNESADGQSATLGFSINLLRDSIRSVPFPGQGVGASQAFQVTRGIDESALEGSLAAAIAQSGSWAGSQLQHHRYHPGGFGTGNPAHRYFRGQPRLPGRAIDLG